MAFEAGRNRRRDNKIKILYQLADKLYQSMSGHHLLHVNETRGLLSGLQGGSLRQTEQMVKEYYVRLISKVLVILAIGCALTALAGLIRFCDPKDSIHLVRDDYGGDVDTVSIYYEQEDSERQEISLNLEPVQYREEELEQAFKQAFLYLEEKMLGENESLTKITSDLQLVTDLPLRGIQVNWISGDYEYLSDDGRIHNEELLKELPVRLTVELACQGELRTREYTVYIQPMDSGEESAGKSRALDILETQLAEHSYEKDIELPAELDGYRYSLTNEDGSGVWMILLGTIIIIIYLILHQKNRLKEQMNKRKHKLQLEYSCFMNQILLYISAGSTVQGALFRIITQYEQQNRTGHPLYQELLLMKNELHTGVAQEEAYIHFGRRTGVLQYIKAMALLTQQMKKGGQGMREQLEQEEHEAFEHRKEQAKKAGEEAGTKLLLPMILLMLVAMVLVMYPAFVSFTNGYGS